MKTEEDRATTINREIAAWLREMRMQWMPPVAERSAARPGRYRGFLKRFAPAFVGACTFIGAMFLHRVTQLGIPFLDSVVIAAPIFLFFGIPYSIWFAWLVSARDSGHGPVRLFLSGIFLPYLVWLVIGFAIRQWVLWGILS